jgi:hypothetical protein
MIRSREVIPASLEHALVANRVLAALASDDLTSQESRDAVDDGLEFLKSVLKGGQLASSRSIEVGSYKAALAYGEGVKAFELISYQQGQDDNPTPYLKELLRCASGLLEHANDNEKAVEDLKIFFQAIRDVALASTERPLETVSW